MEERYRIVQNPLGFFEISPKPAVVELSQHYSDKYYQESGGSYSHSYTESERRYFKIGAEIALNVSSRFFDFKNKNLLDLGCGEGFFSGFFRAQGWSVRLVDFSDEGLRLQNPQLLDWFTQGDLLSFVQQSGPIIKQFDFINLDNVLEHVVDPIELLTLLRLNMAAGSLLRIEVPNDFSAFQQLLTEQKFTEETWVNPPEHLSYFNKHSLTSILESTGFRVLSLQADFPIEQFLVNDHSNYWRDRSLGKGAHQARVLISNYLADQNLDRMIDYQEAAADLEFGRLLTAFVTI